MKEQTAAWRETRKAQQDRRAKRLPERIREVESWGVEFARLNGDYHLRFQITDGKHVDFWPVHAVIVIHKKGRKPRRTGGMDNLKKILGVI